MSSPYYPVLDAETLRKQMREEEARRYKNPDRDKDLEKVWVVYVWSKWATRRSGKRLLTVELAEPRWLLAGFRRRRRRRKVQTYNRFFAKVRRQLGLDKTAIIKVIDLSQVTTFIRRGEEYQDALHFEPPEHQIPGKPSGIAPQTPVVFAPKQKVTRVKRSKANIYFHPKTTKWIGLGRTGVWDRVPGYSYLGALESNTEAGARAEAEQRFPIYNDIQIVGAHEFSKKLRSAFKRSGKVWRQRILWPEPITLDEMLSFSGNQLWTLLVRNRLRLLRDAMMLVRPAEKELWKAVRQERWDDAARHAAILTFLHEICEED